MFNILLAGLRLTVICDEEGIRSAFRDKAHAFGTYVIHQRILRGIGGVKRDAAHLMVDHLIPIVSSTFATNSGIDSFAPSFNAEIYAALLSKYDPRCGLAHTTELESFFGRCLFEATNKAVFGGAFPSGIYQDFEIIDQRSISLLSPIPLFAYTPIRRTREIH